MAIVRADAAERGSRPERAAHLRGVVRGDDDARARDRRLRVRARHLRARPAMASRLLGHTGGMVGYIAGLWCEPATGIGAVVLQSGPGHGPNTLARQVIKVVAAAREGRDPAVEFDAILAERAAADAVEEAEALLDGRAACPARSRRRSGPQGHRRLLPQPRSVDDQLPGRPSRRRCRGCSSRSSRTASRRSSRSTRWPRGWFRVGDDRLGPERMRFDTVIDGHTARAWLSRLGLLPDGRALTRARRNARPRRRLRQPWVAG